MAVFTLETGSATVASYTVFATRRGAHGLLCISLQSLPLTLRVLCPSLQRTTRVLVLIHLCSFLQVLSVALSAEYPSGSGLQGVARTVIEAVGQPVITAHKYGLPHYYIAAILAGVAALLLVSVSYFYGTFLSLQDHEFAQVQSSHTKLFLQLPATTLCFLCLLAGEVLFLPVLMWLNGGGVVQTMAVPAQCAFAVLTTTETLMLTESKLGSGNFGAVSQPLFSLYRKLTLWVFSLGHFLFPYNSHFSLHCLSYILPGLFWVYQVFAKQPYHQDSLNTVEVATGLLLFWSGVMLVVFHVNSLSSSVLTLVFSVSYAAVLPVLLLAVEGYKGRVRRKRTAHFSFELDLRLRWHLSQCVPVSKTSKLRDTTKVSKETRRNLDSSDIDAICRDAYARFQEDEYPLMRLIDYFLLQKRAFP